MTLRLSQVVLDLKEDEICLAHKVAARVGLAVEGIHDLKIVRRALDARRKPRIFKVYSVDFEVDDEDGLLRRCSENKDLRRAPVLCEPVLVTLAAQPRVLVVGMGPAGLFAALGLARSGARVVLVERGCGVEQRCAHVQRFWEEGVLLADSNAQFGEGGAGTFSDGKLTTRVNDPWIPLVLRELVACGAPPDILVEAKPHVGTDRLCRVLLNFRRRLLDLGVDIRFGTTLTGLMLRGDRVCGGLLNNREDCPCSALVLAPGHSARDTYEMLFQQGVGMEAKPFAMGLRVEHPAELINAIQWGRDRDPGLPAADYRLTFNNSASGRGVYSFCMCPGGEVVVASSEPEALVVNGMSPLARDRGFSNSALVVSVGCNDFDGDDALAGMRFQRLWERKAFVASGRNYFAPAENLLRFLGRGTGPLFSTVRPGLQEADLSQVLPAFVVDELRRALPVFNRRMPGFVSAEAMLVGIESRTSAPLRILRDENGQSLSHKALYPAGEGAGYAGGIISSAVDGLKTATYITTACQQAETVQES